MDIHEGVARLFSELDNLSVEVLNQIVDHLVDGHGSATASNVNDSQLEGLGQFKFYVASNTGLIHPDLQTSLQLGQNLPLGGLQFCRGNVLRESF